MEIGVSAEVHFAQKLASNEKKIRDRAIKRLSRYLSVRSTHGSGLSDPDLLKIWKGLFYCMWMQDKPLIQEELSQRITNLVHCFQKTEDALRFVKVFLETQSREWNGIDRLRLDKFMMMVRDMVHQTFMLLSKDDWQESDCRTFARSVYDHVMSAHEPRLPDGLKLHLADIFVEELRKVSLEKLTSKTTLILLQPFIEFILFTNKMELARRIISAVIYKIIKIISSKKLVEEGSKNDGATTDETDKSFLLDTDLLLKLMFEMAGRKVVRASNRALIYKIVKKYSKGFDDSSNSVRSPEQTSSVELDEGVNKMEQHFVCDLQFLRDEGKDGDENKQRKRKRNKQKYTEYGFTTETIDSVDTAARDDDDDMPKAKKKKGQPGNDENVSPPSSLSLGNVENLRLAFSAPCNAATESPQRTRTEEETTPSGIALSSKKKVIFDLRRNKANKFQDYLKSIAKQPVVPLFEPTKSPVTGILKSPVNSPALSLSSSDSEHPPSLSASKKAVGYGRRASAPGNMLRNPGSKKKRSLFKNTGGKSKHKG